MSAGHVGERLVLGKEAVAGVNRFGSGHERRAQECRRRQVAPAGFGRADADRFIGELHRSRLTIGFAVSDDACDPESAARAHDAQRDLSSIRDQDLGEHQASTSIRATGWPYSMACPGSTSRLPTTPSDGATTSWRTPRTSTKPMASPRPTLKPTTTPSLEMK